jgi:hypothetical protein
MKTIKTWQSVSGGTYALSAWNYGGSRGWLAAKDYADVTTGNAGTVGNDYLHPVRANFTIPRRERNPQRIGRISIGNWRPSLTG